MKKVFKITFALCFILAFLIAAMPTSSAASYNEDDFRYPISAVYESFGKQGYAYGRITVKANSWVNNNEGGCPTDAVVYWANEDGKLEGYSPVCTFKLSTRSTAFEFSDLLIIPEGADRLLVYTKIHGTDKFSTQSVEALLPENSAYSITKEPIMSFVVVSDTHLRSSDTSAANVKFRDMLSDVNSMLPDAAGIFINGDNINSGRDLSDTLVPRAELAKLVEYATDLTEIPIFMGVGNHDLWPNASRDTMKILFANTATLPDGTHPTSIHYDFYLNGYHFVFVGDDDGDPTYATLSASTLTWLDETLAEGYSSGAPTFIFMHQAITNTVAGSLTDFGQEWDGITNAVEVRSILAKYPQAILFSSHSHYSMDSVRNAYSGGDTFPFNFNTGSLADVSDLPKEAQGYIVEVYEDAVILKGRDFAANEWKGSAQYAVLYAEGENGGSFTPVIPNTGNEETPKPTQTAKKTTFATTSPKADESELESEQQAEDGDGGCGSSIGASALTVAILPCAFALKRKKRK